MGDEVVFFHSPDGLIGDIEEHRDGHSRRGGEQVEVQVVTVFGTITCDVEKRGFELFSTFGDTKKDSVIPESVLPLLACEFDVVSVSSFRDFRGRKAGLGGCQKLDKREVRWLSQT